MQHYLFIELTQVTSSINNTSFAAKGGGPSPFVQFGYLLKRNFMESFRCINKVFIISRLIHRNVSVIWVKVATSILIAVIMGSTFFQVKLNQDSVQDRINALFFAVTHLVLSAYTALPKCENYYCTHCLLNV